MSNTTNIDIGVPQGSILGRFFFFYLLMTCLSTFSINNTFILFADDINIIISDWSANKQKLN